MIVLGLTGSIGMMAYVFADAGDAAGTVLAYTLETTPGSPPTVKIAARASTIFVSAFLLFQVQPMMGRYVLPWESTVQVTDGTSCGFGLHIGCSTARQASRFAANTLRTLCSSPTASSVNGTDSTEPGPEVT